MAKFRAGEECNPILASVPPYAGRSRPSQWWPQTRPALTAPARGGFEIGGRDGRMSSRAAEQKNGPVGCAASAPPGKYSRPTSPRPPLPQARRRHAVEMALDPIIINRDDIAQWTRCSLGYGGSPLADLVAFSHLQFSQIRGPPALPICANGFRTSSVIALLPAWFADYNEVQISLSQRISAPQYLAQPATCPVTQGAHYRGQLTTVLQKSFLRREVV
jgi:hypothetical protein